MSLWSIALNNLKIRKIKMIFIILGMIIGTATIVALFTITISMENEIQERFEQAGTRILVSPQRETLSLSYRGITTAQNISGGKQTLPEGQLVQLQEVSGWNQVDVISPKLVAALSGDNGSLLALGVDFNEELKIKRYWELQGKYPQPGTNQVLLGFDLARRLNVGIDDALELEGRKYQISGVLNETGTEEDKLVYFNLTDLQEVSGNVGQLSMAEISVAGSVAPELTLGLIEEVNSNISGLVATQVQDAVGSRRELVDRLAKFSIMVTVIVVAIGSLIMGSTMMASVKERTAEIGVFRATGFRKSHIMKILFMEAGVLSVLAGVGGYLLGMTLAAFVVPVVIDLQAGIIWSPLLAVLAIGLTGSIGLVASFYPAYKAANLDPVEALRFI